MAAMKSIPGYRFHPTDVELVQYFLKRKVMGKRFPCDVIAELDIYKYPPWDLPDHSLLKTGDLEWYFFCPRGKKYSSGGRMNRATECGYWKTTGKDRSVENKKLVVGMIKTLVFHMGKAPKGDRTDWVLHEYRLQDKDLADKGVQQDSYVICKVFQKDGPGPRNGAQYGRPFNEEDWDKEDEINCVESAPVAALPAAVPIQPASCHSSVVNNVNLSVSECYGLTSVSCLTGPMPSCSAHPSAPSNQVDGDITPVPGSSIEDNIMAPTQNTTTEKVDNPPDINNAEGTPCFDPNEIFGGLGDLDGLFEMGGIGHGFSCGQNGGYTVNEMLSAGDGLRFPDPLDYLELGDLDTPLLWETNEQGNWSQDNK